MPTSVKRRGVKPTELMPNEALGLKNGLKDVSLYEEMGPGVPTDAIVRCEVLPAYGNIIGLFAVTHEKKGMLGWSARIVEIETDNATHEFDREATHLVVIRSETA